MKNMKLSEAIEKSCVVKFGVKQLDFEKLRENGLIPIPKSNDEYLNIFSEQLSQPLSDMPYPFIWTSVVKRSKNIEKVSTRLIQHALDAEEYVASAYNAHVVVLTKFDFGTEYPHGVFQLFEEGYKSIAQVIIEDQDYYVPVSLGESSTEIVLKAINRLPGHSLIFKVPELALDFYDKHKNQYVWPKQEQYISELEKFANMPSMSPKFYPFSLAERKKQISRG